MTREEKEQTGEYLLHMARFLEDGCYQQEMLLKAVHIIDEALEQEPRWILVSEKSPEKSGKYWCTFGGTHLTGSDYYTTESDAKEIFDDAAEEHVGWQSQNVIAWMPLPTPYEPQESEDNKIKNPMKQTLDFLKNLYLQNKEEIDSVAKEYEAESEGQMDGLNKAISDVAYILDSLILLRQIQQTGDCNICEHKECWYKPKPGQMVRYNCPHFLQKDRK